MNAIAIVAASNQGLNIFAQALRMRQEEAARRYASADKSDPFAFSRAMSHARFGLCGTRRHPETKETVSCMYDADTYPARREVDPRWAPLQKLNPGLTKVDGTQFKNVVRP